MGASVQMKGPDWCKMEYGEDCFKAVCKDCGEIARLQFGEDEQKLLTFAYKDEVGRYKQVELAEFILHFVLIKLRRECNCDKQR